MKLGIWETADATFMLAQVSGLETKLGLTAGPSVSSAYGSVATASPAGRPMGSTLMPASGSAMDRIQRLERRVEAVGVACTKTEVKREGHGLSQAIAAAPAAVACLNHFLPQPLSAWISFSSGSFLDAFPSPG